MFINNRSMCGIRLEVWQNPQCQICNAVFGCQGDTRERADGCDTDAGPLSLSLSCLGRTPLPPEINDSHDYAGTQSRVLLRRRGPDSRKTIDVQKVYNLNERIKNENERDDQHHANDQNVSFLHYHRVQLHASVLQMRQDLTHQPVRINASYNRDSDGTTEIIKQINDQSDDDSMYLCWNGEVYERILLDDTHHKDNKNAENDKNQEVWQYNISDTRLVADLLGSRFSSSTPETTREQQKVIADSMSSLRNAEFAFLILTRDGVFFGRDSWGRRSLLLWECPHNDCTSFIISSVAEYTDCTIPKSTTAKTSSHPPLDFDWTEVPPGQVRYLGLVKRNDGTVPMITALPFHELEAQMRPLIPTHSLDAAIPQTLVGISDQLWSASLELEFHLRRAVAMRMDHSTSCTGVLFSGGVDSAVLAALAADVMASTPTRNHKLHLYNVSFGPDRLKSADRQAALVSYDNICKKIKVDANKSGKVDSAVNVYVIFHDIAVDWQQVCDVEQHVRTLLSPKSTVMDVNIATALWFASSGAASTVGGESKVKDFHSASSDGFSPPSPRVLLLGMGADEQMGGYGRHRKAFTEGGWDLLRKELKMDQDRLWERNLGRDDRLVSDHGKEARFPFLDAHVVSFLTALQRDKPHLICNMDLPPGEGDKQILRLVAKRLGLDHASGLVKRAIQFGSRISHLSDTKRFGSRRKAKGETKI